MNYFICRPPQFVILFFQGPLRILQLSSLNSKFTSSAFKFCQSLFRPILLKSSQLFVKFSETRIWLYCIWKSKHKRCPPISSGSNSNFLNFLTSFVKFVKHFLANKNLLCYSETLQSFVLPPMVEDWRQSDYESYLRVMKAKSITSRTINTIFCDEI